MSEVNPQSEALKWLLEMEIVNDPNVLNSLILNIYKITNEIQDVEVVTDSFNKRMLVYLSLKLGWWKKESKRQKIIEITENLLEEALPSYSYRIVTDKAILNKALEIVKK